MNTVESEYLSSFSSQDQIAVNEQIESAHSLRLRDRYPEKEWLTFKHIPKQNNHWIPKLIPEDFDYLPSFVSFFNDVGRAPSFLHSLILDNRNNWVWKLHSPKSIRIKRLFRILEANPDILMLINNLECSIPVMTFQEWLSQFGVIPIPDRFPSCFVNNRLFYNSTHSFVVQNGWCIISRRIVCFN